MTPYIHRIGTLSIVVVIVAVVVVIFLPLKIMGLIYSCVCMVDSVAPSPSSPHYTAQDEILHML